MIDVGDASLNLWLNVSWVGIALVALIALIPFRLKDGRNRWQLALLPVAFGFYALYEWLMPSRMDIRLDLLVIWPLLGVVLVATLIRLLVIGWRRYRSRREGSESQ